MLCERSACEEYGCYAKQILRKYHEKIPVCPLIGHTGHTVCCEYVVTYYNIIKRLNEWI